MVVRWRRREGKQRKSSSNFLKMKIIIGFESSGRVRQAFEKKGHEVWSCDLLPTEIPGNHFQEDFFEVMQRTVDYWDFLIAHPVCTYVCGSGIHWNKRRPERQALTDRAIQDFKKILALPIKKMALENPIGVLSTQVYKPTQIIQPYNFGEDASKATCLWLRGLPRLNGTKYCEPRMIDGKKRWSNQTDSGQNKLGPSEKRWAERSKTYQGIADAMANQWG